ncbi:MAG TPA: isoprenylcysteine carboxyl methyltransferase [Bacteroidales bacterium]|nr:MAG: hypothetical protein A2X11_08990 [Bacteroidetes bacterium GWE2_42_24]OFY26156.1 MAG: hypothetical protein A2X09_13575 [Bacteroidetes bacterium GWF2_43_11]HAQ64780.1 isoprenylcysteine carboxyl methyltransferase [Bacteroidales bacterium]HBZ67847.1 isoprenylcysteine carboxyl methyltransferase [Bacteroidales bacterium]
MAIQEDTTSYQSGWVSYSLVFLQVLLIVLLLYSQVWNPNSYWLMIPVSLSGILACWAIIAMRRSRINIMPDLLPGALLITTGPYRLIRHPMYTSLLILFIPLVATQYSHQRLSALLGLLIVLVIKIIKEEKQLKATFQDYSAYRVRTYYLFPWLL